MSAHAIPAEGPGLSCLLKHMSRGLRPLPILWELLASFFQNPLVGAYDSYGQTCFFFLLTRDRSATMQDPTWMRLLVHDRVTKTHGC